MMFFGSLLQFQCRSPLRSSIAHDDQSSLRALWQVVIDRLCQHHKLTLSLAVCLCLVTPAHANHADTALDANVPTISIPLKSNTVVDHNEAIDPSVDDSEDLVEDVENIDGLAPASLWQSELNEPSLYALLDAEFAADRDDRQRAIAIYKQQSFKADATAVFERALSLSLRNERVEDSLSFAKSWQDQNPDHVPAWFYVAHLALRAHDYILAGETLNRILRYDPRADLSVFKKARCIPSSNRTSSLAPRSPCSFNISNCCFCFLALA